MQLGGERPNRVPIEKSRRLSHPSVQVSTKFQSARDCREATGQCVRIVMTWPRGAAQPELVPLEFRHGARERRVGVANQ